MLIFSFIRTFWYMIMSFTSKQHLGIYRQTFEWEISKDYSLRLKREFNYIYVIVCIYFDFCGIIISICFTCCRWRYLKKFLDHLKVQKTLNLPEIQKLLDLLQSSNFLTAFVLTVFEFEMIVYWFIKSVLCSVEGSHGSNPQSCSSVYSGQCEVSSTEFLNAAEITMFGSSVHLLVFVWD